MKPMNTLAILTSVAVILAIVWGESKRQPAADIPIEVADTAPADAGGVVTRPSRPGSTMRQFFDALMQVESGGDCQAVGDSGRSLGPYQIGIAYWLDGGGSKNTYLQLVVNRDYCERIMYRYWKRYCPEALTNRDYETLARVHVGGPRGADKQSTKAYWQRVKSAMGE